MLQSFRENFAAVCQLNCTKPDFINEVKVMQHGSKRGKSIYRKSRLCSTNELASKKFMTRKVFIYDKKSVHLFWHHQSDKAMQN